MAKLKPLQKHLLQHLLQLLHLHLLQLLKLRPLRLPLQHLLLKLNPPNPQRNKQVLPNKKADASPSRLLKVLGI